MGKFIFKIILLFVFIGQSVFVHAQYTPRNILFCGGFGLNIPVGTSLNEVFGAGMSLNLGLELNAYKHRLYAIPNYSFNYHINYLDIEGLQENLWWHSAGADVRYYMKTVSDTVNFNFYPVVGLHYNWVGDAVGPQPGWRANTIKLINGKGFSLKAGAGFVWRTLYFQAAYYFFNPKCQVDEDYLASIGSSVGGLYSGYTTSGTSGYEWLNLSYLRVEIGTRFPIR